MSTQTPISDITVRIKAEDTSFDLSSPLVISFSIENEGEKERKICKYMTPIEGFKGNIFRITNERGERISYKGPMVKRGKPSESSFVSVAGGETLVYSIDLANGYSFMEPGVYSVQFKGRSMNDLPDSNVLNIEIGPPPGNSE